MRLPLLSLLILTFSTIQAQNVLLEFNANHTCTEVNLDSIWIENLTQGGKMVLYYPDNTANLIITDIGEFDPEPEHLYVSQNYPNPFSALTYIDVFLATPDAVSLFVYDLKGRTVASHEDMLEEGMHRFSFSAGAESTYILNVTSGKQVEKRIMLQMGTTGPAASEISYLGASEDDISKTAPKSTDFNFNPGDEMRFTGYVTDLAGNVDYGVINDAPEASTEYLFDIANNLPDQPSEITGEDYVPENATDLVYEVEAVEGLVYLWSVPDGWEITDGQGSHVITVDAGSEGGEISAKAENNCGLSEASVLSVGVYYDSEPGTVTDIDGNVYQIVIINNQAWMAENLRVTKYRNGDAIPTGLSDTDWSNTTQGAYAINDHNHASADGIDSPAEMVAAYGKLYNWYAVDDSSGLCPEGWRVSGDDDWNQLISYLVWVGYPNWSNAPYGNANALRSCRQIDSPAGGDCNTSEHPRWNSHETHHGFDSFGFSAFPAGDRNSNGNFGALGSVTAWWTSAEHSSLNAGLRMMGLTHGYVAPVNIDKRRGFSVRCVWDGSDQTSFILNLEKKHYNSGNVTGAGLYEPGQSIGISAIANESWAFSHWSGDTEYIDDPFSVNTIVSMPAQNISLTANFFFDNDIIYGDGVMDIDGNEYVTVIIGEQEWMAENLRVTRDAEGNNITRDCYDNNPNNCNIYGGLYSWVTIMNGEDGSNSNPSGVQGICPDGWHVPSDAEWTELINDLDSQGFPNRNVTYGMGNALKSCRQIDSYLGGDCDTSEHPRWNHHQSHHGFDAFGFSALPGGRLQTGESFYELGRYGYWWSSTPNPYSSSGAYISSIFNGEGEVSQNSTNKQFSYSLRCVRNYNLTLDVNPTGSGNVTGTGNYEAGEEVGITAVANGGWAFINWSGDTEYLDDTNAPNAIVTMPDYNIALTANFVAQANPDIIYGDGVTDIDGNEYVTVIIGNQEWMAENLQVSKYNNGDNIPTGLSGDDWDATQEGAFGIYSNDEEMLDAYGKLYNWYAVNDARGLCPEGWHVPSDADWTQLVDYVADQGFLNEFNNQNGAGNALKSCRQVESSLGGECETSVHPRWNSQVMYYGFDEFGFSALPGGHRFSDNMYTGMYTDIGQISYMWSSTGGPSTNAWSQSISGHNGSVQRSYINKSTGYSIRCLRYTADQTHFVLNLEASPTYAGTTTGAGLYEVGEEVGISAIANEGYVFANWTGDSTYVNDPFSANTTVSMHTQNISLTANFYLDIDPDITYGDGVTDIDGNEYATVIIGNQEWMAENLRVTRDAEGNDIDRYCYEDDPDWCDFYGGLYTWTTLMNDENSSSNKTANVQGICPTGWYVPSQETWIALVDYLLSQGFPNSSTNQSGASNALKSCRKVNSPLGGECNTSEHPRWNSSSIHHGFDKFGFSALPGGARVLNGNFIDVGGVGYWWSATESNSFSSWYINIGSSGGSLSGWNASKGNSYSIRCVRDLDE